MKKIMWLVISALSLSLTLVATDALAKRAGGGGNAGMQRSVAPAMPASSPASTASKPAAQPSNAAAGAATGAATAAPAKSSWMAPLMAFAAGGLLAAAFMGGGFDGISGMDILVLLLFVAGAYLFLRRRAANMAQQAAGQPSPAAGGYARESSAPMASGGLRDVVMGSRVDEMGVASAASTTGAVLAPAWFDEASFTQQAKNWYVRLQSAWDKKDFAFLSAITTPALLDEFKVLRAQQPDDIHTRVDEVHVQVIAWDKEQDQWVLTVRFSGYIAEEAGAFPHAFTEYWHLLRIGEADGEWRLAGIQQA